MVLKDRINIERGLDNHESFKAIALLTSKDDNPRLFGTNYSGCASALAWCDSGFG